MATRGDATPRRAADPVRRRRGVVFFVLFLIATGFPGVVPFNRIEPRVAGLPFVLAWIIAWILAGSAVLWSLDRREDR